MLEDDTWDANMWLGVPTQPFFDDAWVHQEIIPEVKSDSIVEAGTFRGRSALLWAMAAHQGPRAPQN